MIVVILASLILIVLVYRPTKIWLATNAVKE